MTLNERLANRAKFINQEQSENEKLQDISQESSSSLNNRLSERSQYLKDQNFLKEYDENEIERGVEHSIGSMAAHGLGSIVSLPGNIRDIILSAAPQAQEIRKKFNNKFGLSWDESYFDQKSEEEKNPDSITEKIATPFKFLVNKLPNSQDVNEFIDEIGGGALAPRNETEKLANELSEDIVNSFLTRAPKGIVSNFLIPGVGTFIRKGLEMFDVSATGQQTGKIMSNIALNMANIANPRQMVGANIRHNRRLIPANDMIDVRPQDAKYLNLLENRLRSGGTSPSKTAALTKIEEFNNAIINNQVPARQSYDFYRTINELKTNYGAFNVEGAAKPAHVFNLNKVQKLNNNMLNRYGSKNRRFLNEFRENNAAWASLEQSDAIAGYVAKNYHKPFVSEAAKSMFAKSNVTLPAVIGLSALERAQAIVQRLGNPTLRKYYGQVLRHSTERNSAAMINSLQRFDKEAKKEESQ